MNETLIVGAWDVNTTILVAVLGYVWRIQRDMGGFQERIQRDMGDLRERMARLEGLFEGFTGRKETPAPQ